MSEQIFVELTEEELKHRAERLAGRLVELDELEEERKEANKDFGDRKKVLSKEVRDLTAIRHKGEYRDTQASMFQLPSGPKGRKKDDA